MAEKYVEKIKSASSGEVYTIRDANAALASDLTTHTSNSDIHVTTVEKATWSGKQDVISDLATIRSGAQAGATALQSDSLKTINNQSLVGSGNITIQGGSGTSDYADLGNKPQINSITLSGNKSATDLGLLTSSDLDDYYTKTETDNGFLSSSIYNDLVLNNNLISEDEYTTLKLKTSTEVVTLDTVAIDDMTYREVFETNNSLGIDPGFENNSWAPLIVPENASSPTLVETATEPNATGAVGKYVLKISASRSAQIATTDKYLASTRTFMAANVKCTRHSSGYLGVTRGTNPNSAYVKAITNGFVVVTKLSDHFEDFRGTVGSYASANLDGYVDMPVIINMSIFSSNPTASQLQELYETYLKIKRNNGSYVKPAYRTLIQGSKPSPECSSTEARNIFYEEMSAEAASIGMADTVYQSASGLTTANVTTTNDTVRLGALGMAYPEMVKIWSCKQKTVKTSGVVRTITVDSTIVDHDGWADIMKTDYLLLGGKTGTYGGRYNYCITLKAKDTQDIFTICTSSTTAETSTNNRHVYAKKLADIAKLLRAAGEYGITNSDNIQNADCKTAVKEIEATMSGLLANATVILTPQYGTAYDGQDILDGTDKAFLYSLNGSTQFITASMTKMMTFYLTVKWIKDLDSTFELLAEDVESGSGPALSGGEVFTFRDALYVLMLPSSNTIANCLARVVGQKIYSIRNRT